MTGDSARLIGTGNAVFHDVSDAPAQTEPDEATAELPKHIRRYGGEMPHGPEGEHMIRAASGS